MLELWLASGIDIWSTQVIAKAMPTVAIKGCLTQGTLSDPLTYMFHYVALNRGSTFSYGVPQRSILGPLRICHLRTITFEKMLLLVCLKDHLWGPWKGLNFE